MPTGGRKTHHQVLHEISGQGGFGQLSGKIGVLPVGAVASQFHFLTSQAFNSTTNTLSLGTTPGGVDIANAIDVKAISRADTAVPIAASGPYAVDTPIYYTLLSTGAAPTAGVITVWLDYLPGAG
jgi:hypothetical protein